MTPLPKKKHARSRTKTRKAAISFKIPQLIRCPKCNSLRFPHSKCPNCGFYKDVKFVETKISKSKQIVSAEKPTESENKTSEDEKK